MGQTGAVQSSKRMLCFIIGLWAMALSAQAQPEGMVAVKSPYSVTGTLDRLAAVAEERGMKVMARVNHAANAAGVDMALRPTELLIFGNPKVGTPLMQCAQSVAIDLPQKALAWEDEAGQVWLAYNDPFYLSERHKLGNCRELLEKVNNALGGLVGQATRAE